MRRIVIAIVLLAGCTDAADTSLGGSLTQDRPDSALDELAMLAEEHGGKLAIMESFPEQFSITGLTTDACADLRDVLAQKPWVQGLGQCSSPRSGY